MSIFEEFLDVLGLTSKRRASQEAQLRAKKAYNMAFKEGYSIGYNDAVSGLPNKYNPQKPIVSIKQKPEILLLFIKAERGGTLVDVLREDKNLSGISPDMLVSNVIRIWAGSATQYDSSGLKIVFSLPNEVSNIGREYDSIAIELPYPMNAPIITKGTDSYTIAEVIRAAIAQGLSCNNISSRIPFSKIEHLPIIEV